MPDMLKLLFVHEALASRPNPSSQLIMSKSLYPHSIPIYYAVTFYLNMLTLGLEIMEHSSNYLILCMAESFKLSGGHYCIPKSYMASFLAFFVLKVYKIIQQDIGTIASSISQQHPKIENTKKQFT